MDKLYEHERLYQSKRDAGPELFDALNEAICLIPATQRTAIKSFQAVLEKARGDSPAPPRKDIAE